MLFGFESDPIMAVSHHGDPVIYKNYVVNAAHVDPERDAHIGRHFNLYASGFYKPPIALSLPVALENIKQETNDEFEELKKGQARIMMISTLQLLQPTSCLSD